MSNKVDALYIVDINDLVRAETEGKAFAFRKPEEDIERKIYDERKKVDIR